MRKSVLADSIDSRFKECIVSNPIIVTKWSTVIFLMINLPARGSGLHTHEHTALLYSPLSAAGFIVARALELTRQACMSAACSRGGGGGFVGE